MFDNYATPMYTYAYATVGVIGGTDGVAKVTLELADALGYQAKTRWTLITGGNGEKAESAVKDAAMAGAARAEARRVGILRGADRWSFSPSGSNLAFLHTNAGHGRNLLTGGVADVVFALKGGAGTLSEIACAQWARRHVVFVCSSDEIGKLLRRLTQGDKFDAQNGKLQRIVKGLSKLGGPCTVADVISLGNVALSKRLVIDALNRTPDEIARDAYGMTESLASRPSPLPTTSLTAEAADAVAAMYVWLSSPK